MPRFRPFLLLLLLAMPLPATAAEAGPVRWTMLNVSAEPGVSGDAHLLRFADGTRILIDTGYDRLAAQRLLPWLRAQGITRLDQVLITHAHRNHYGGVLRLLRSGIQVGRVRFDPPDRQRCDAERPWGCDWRFVQATRAELSKRGVPLDSYRSGEVLYQGPDTRLVVLATHDGVSAPIGATDINETSPLLRLEAFGTRVLFTGDIGIRFARQLVASGVDLRADLLKVPHHGLSVLPEAAFFSAVAPQAAFVPGPWAAWQSDRGRQARDWFAARKIPVWVNGRDGHVEVSIDASGWRVRTAQASPADRSP
jgi:competence protein ComEC